MAKIIIDNTVSPMTRGQISKALDKRYRFEGGQVLTLRQWIESAPIVGKSTDTQEYSAHRVHLDNPKLTTPKTFYNLELPDGTSLPIPKCVWEVVTIEQSAVKPYTFGEQNKAISAKLAGSGVEWMLDVGWENWEQAYQWLMASPLSDIIAYAPTVESESWNGQCPA